MSRDWRLLADDIIAFCEAVIAYTDGLSRADFFADRKTYDATIRNIELIGEAARMLPADLRHRHDDIPWKKIIATRNYLTHVYFNLDDDVLWDIVTQKAPELLERMRSIRDESA